MYVRATELHSTSVNIAVLCGVQFKVTLNLLLQGNTELLVTVDETHKDRSTSRWRQEWAHPNSGGLKTRE